MWRIDEKGHKNSYTYDERGLQSTYTTPLGSCQKRTYDQNGMVLSQTEEGLGTISYNYSGGRLESVRDGTGAVTGLTYDAYGNIASSTDGESNRTEWIYDAAGNLSKETAGNHASTTDGEKGTARAIYDLYGNLLSRTDAMGNKTGYTYDSMNRCITETNALGKMAEYSYNKIGQLAEYTDFAGNKTTYTYDRAENLLTVTDNTGTIRRSYDVLNRVTGVTDCNGKTITYKYDELGNRVEITYPGGRAVRYSWDACQNLTEVTDTEGNTLSYRYDLADRLTETIRGDGSREERSYDSAGRLSTITDRKKDGALIRKLVYNYDYRGNISSIVDETSQSSSGEPSREYTGENAGEPTGENTAEADGGRFEATQDFVCTYDTDNRLKTYNGETVTYDSNGNMTHGPVDGQMADLSYDAYDRLIRVTGEDGSETVYTYDGENIRIKAAHTGADGTTRETIYSQLQIGTGVLRFLYNAQYGVQTDTNSLYYMRARYCSQDTRRFLNLYFALI